MKTDTQIMNELAVSSSCLHMITEEESRSLKDLLLSMFKDIADLCDKNELTYMMGGGTCLGAMRHNGFIPWDDDLDIMMPRDSYERLIHLLSEGLLGDRYEYTTPSKNVDSKNPFLKIYLKGTLDVEIISESVPGPQGIYIDVFPMDFAPRKKFVRTVKGLVSDFLQSVCSCVLYTEYPSLKYREFMLQSREGKIRYIQRMILGHIFGVIPHRKWVWWFDQFNSSCVDTGFMTIPSGRKHYLGECRPTNVYLPVSTLRFEDVDVNVPNDVHEYLKSMYNNYMEVPPIEKRERHFVYKFKLPE